MGLVKDVPEIEVLVGVGWALIVTSGATSGDALPKRRMKRTADAASTVHRAMVAMASVPVDEAISMITCMFLAQLQVPKSGPRTLR